MKRVFSIFFSLSILLSGMHFSISSHHCHSEAAVFEKVSFTGKVASCGMEDNDDSTLPGSFFKTHCCDNSTMVLTVDSHYAPTFNFVKTFVQTDWLVMNLPTVSLFSYKSNVNVYHTSVLPPGNYLASAVSLPNICVFLI